MKKRVWLSLLVMSMGMAARADSYYVSTKGSDENPGSETKPFRTIQKAASLARAGDTILVRGGVYREAVALRFSGQEGKPIVLKNYAGERPVIQPGERGEQPPGQGLLLQAQEGYQKSIGWITIEGRFSPPCDGAVLCLTPPTSLQSISHLSQASRDLADEH